MQNFIQVGDQLEVVAPANLTSGQGVLIGALFGVATTAALSGAPVVLRMVGVVTQPKATGAIAAGAKVYWDATNSRVTTTATSNTMIGHAARAALSADALAYVRLQPGAS
jgi:predicted RecA/RadA family phage recombinase